MDYSKKVKGIILSKFRSINSFAKHVKIPYSTIATALDKENGIKKMSIDNVLAICAALDIDAETFEPKQHLVGVELNPVEAKLINNYRSLEHTTQNAIDVILNSLAGNVDSTEQDHSRIYLAAASGTKGMNDEQLASVQDDIRAILEEDDN